MFERSANQYMEIKGARQSEPISHDNAAALGVLGSMLKGAIRQLVFGADGALFVLAGRGVTRLDPDTLTATGSWLEGEAIGAIYPCGERFWVFKGDYIYLAPFGGDLGQPFAEHTYQSRTTHVVHGALLAAVLPQGVVLFDSVSGESRCFSFPKEWFDDLDRQDAANVALLSPCGQIVGAAHRGSYAMLWNAATGECVYDDKNRCAAVLLDKERGLNMEANFWFNFKTDEYKFLPEDEDGALLVGNTLLIGSPEGGVRLQDPTDFSTTLILEPFDKEYGTVSRLVYMAHSETHTAAYCAMRGILRVASKQQLVESLHWSGGPKGLSASLDGTRALIWRDWGDGRADVVDLSNGTMYEIRAGLVAPGITQDGNSLLLPIGNNHNARTVYRSEFGASDGQEVHKIRSSASDFQSFGADKYAILTDTFRGQGEIAMHQAGLSRALAKVKHHKEAPDCFSLGYGANELAVVWEKELIIYDITKRPTIKETIDVQSHSIAMGPLAHLSYIWRNDEKRELFIRTANSELSVALDDADPQSPRRHTRLAFSEDGALLFVGRKDGVLEMRLAETGEVLHTLPLTIGGFVSLQLVGHTLWCMGADGCVLMLGVASDKATAPREQHSLGQSEGQVTKPLADQSAPVKAAATTRQTRKTR